MQVGQPGGAGSSGSAPQPETAPEHEKYQFARAVYVLFLLWPALRHAVAEEWGGPESREKMEFLLSYVCDEHGSGTPKSRPDVDELAEVMENYVIDEFECRLDDDSATWAASNIYRFHERIFSKHEGDAVLAPLEEALTKLKGTRPQTVHHMTEHDSDASDDGEEDPPDEPMDEEAPPPMAHAQRERPEPEIDEDGFQTVAPRRRR